LTGFNTIYFFGATLYYWTTVQCIFIWFIGVSVHDCSAAIFTVYTAQSSVRIYTRIL